MLFQWKTGSNIKKEELPVKEEESLNEENLVKEEKSLNEENAAKEEKQIKKDESVKNEKEVKKEKSVNPKYLARFEDDIKFHLLWHTLAQYANQQIYPIPIMLGVK